MKHALQIDVNTWRDFTKVMKIASNEDWLYRGQEDAAWGLCSSLDRELDSAYGHDYVVKSSGMLKSCGHKFPMPTAERSAIQSFRALTRGTDIALLDDVNTLAAMQHYGAKTRLLDFSTSLFVALFFAYEKKVTHKLWLVNPPPYAAGICLFVLAMNVIDKMAVGHMLCVNANGKVARYQAFLGTSLVCTLPIAWMLMIMGVGVYSVGYAMVATMFVCASGRVWFARKLVGMSARYWLRSVFSPIVMVSVIAGLCGLLPRLLLTASFGRVCMTTVAVEFALLPLSWFLILTHEEKTFVTQRIGRFIKR